MADAKVEMFTAGKIAQTLAVPGPQVKKAIEQLKIKPIAKKGACSYYSKEAMAKVKSSFK